MDKERGWVALFCRLLAAIGVTILGQASILAEEIQQGFYADPGLYPNRQYINRHFGEHIDPFNGALEHHYVDLHLPGNGKFDLKVIRSYNSTLVDPENPAHQIAPVGVGWDIHFGRVLINEQGGQYGACSNFGSSTSTDNPVLELPDGSRQIWTWPNGYYGSNPQLISPQFWKMNCDGANGVIVTSPEGTVFEMRRAHTILPALGYYAWMTTKITDKNGNYATIEYAPNGNQVTTVTTNDGRVLTFSYITTMDGSVLVYPRLSQISANTGQKVTYVQSRHKISELAAWYPEALFLHEVQLPDSTSWKYTYNGNLYIDSSGKLGGAFLMSAVTTPRGGGITYGYSLVKFSTDNSTQWKPSNVVQSKTSSDGGTWSFAYTPGTTVGKYDQTVETYKTAETSPAEVTTYQHYGYGTVSSGSVWMVGLLASKSSGSLQSEAYAWTKMKLSSETLDRPGSGMAKQDLDEFNTPLLSRKTITRDGASYITEYSNYDSYGNPGKIVETGPNGESRQTLLTYYLNIAKWIVKQPQDETYEFGSYLYRNFDSNGNLSSINRDGVLTSYTYDAEGNVSSTTFPRNLTHYYSDYRRGIPQSESQPESISISRVVSDAGNVTSETDGEGHTRTFSYDAMNRVTGVGYPIGNPVSISYTATTKTATRGILTESTIYDGFGRPTSITLGGVKRTFSYDALGRKTFESNPGDTVGTTYSYDILDRVTKITNADGTSRAFAYGPGTTTVTDERGKVTKYAYRAYGDPAQQFLMAITAPDPAANVTIARNSKDLVTSITQGGLKRTYGYNANYYLTSVTNPETGTTTYGRDAAGNMTSRAVGSSGTTLYTYDGHNRLIGVAYPGSTPSVTQAYSKTHKLKSVDSTAASRSYLYDANDNLVRESLAVDGLTLTTGYAYNGNDQLASLTYPYSGSTVSFAPDVLGRPTVVSGYVSAVSYWPSGQIKQIAYANGTVSAYGQNRRLWPSGFSTQLGTTYYHKAAYTYDGVGNLTAISDTADASYNRTLGYDALNRLTTANGPWGTGTLAYSGVGNLTSQMLGSNSLSYTYDAQNRLASVAGSRVASYTYDAYGDIATGAGNTYAYDGVPNLRCVNCGTANEVAHTYDGLNQRLSVTKGSVKTYEVYGAHGQLLAEYTPSQSNRLVEYLYLGGKRIAERGAQGVTPVVASSRVALALTPNPLLSGQPLTMTATVGGDNPTGQVTFYVSWLEGPRSLGSVPVEGGRATLVTNFFDGAFLGTYSLIAAYTEGTEVSRWPAIAGESSGPQPLTITTANPAHVTLAATPSTITASQTVTLTATVTGNAPTGSVSFWEGSSVKAALLGRAPLIGGKATLAYQFSNLKLTGTHAIFALYDGDSQNGASVSDTLALLVTVPGTDGARGRGATYYFHNDISGTPLLATDAAGAVVWKENYRPYGEKLVNAAASAGNKLGFAGKPYDPNTGLSYLGARYYDPVLGRFTGVDPKEVDPNDLYSFNRYAYANNNPYKFVDPDGRSPLSVMLLHVGGGALVGGAVAGAVNAGAQLITTGTVRWGGVGGVADAAGDGAMLGAILGPMVAGPAAAARASNGTSPLAVDAIGAMRRMEFEAADYHGIVGNAVKSRGPVNGQSALDTSVQVKSTSPRRVGIDYETGDFVVFDKTINNIYHGHVRQWGELHSDMQNALKDAGMTDKRGNVLGATGGE